MTKKQYVFEDAKDVHVKSIVLYPNGSSVLCYDASATIKVSGADLKAMFEKNLVLVNVSGVLYRPTMFEDKSTYYEVSLIVMGTTVAETLAFKSDTLPA